MTTHVSRRAILSGTTVAAAAGALASCSFDRGDGGGASSDGGGGATTAGGNAEINVNAFGALPTFIQNFNPFSPADGLVGANYFYDPIGYIDLNDASSIKPWLAETIEFHPESRSATVTLRDDITWSDGKKITTEDLVYSVMGLKKQAEEQNAIAPVRDYEAKAVDERVAEITWTEEHFNLNVIRTLATLPPYPKHVFEKEDLSKFTNPEPVSSSPFTLKSFSPQQVSLALRDDHFMGPWESISTLNWIPFGNPEIGKSMVIQGKMDIATMSMQNAQQTLVEPGNHYWVISGAGSEGMMFNCGRAPFNDVNARNAIYAALDTDKIHKLFDIGVVSTSPTTMDNKVFGDAVAEEYREPHKADPEAAKKYLQDGGWTVEGGHLTKDGESYPISFKTVADYANWSTWSDGVKAQLKEVLGIDVKILKIPDDQHSEQISMGDFDLAMNWVGGGPNLASVYADFHSKLAVPIGTEAENGNAMRINDPELDALLDEARQEFDEAKVRELSKQMQKIVVEKCYCAPWHASAAFLEASGKNFEGFPEMPLPKGAIVPRPYGPEGWQTLSKLTRKA